MGTESPWRWGRGTISANLDVIWGMSAYTTRRDTILADGEWGHAANETEARQ